MKDGSRVEAGGVLYIGDDGKPVKAKTAGIIKYSQPAGQARSKAGKSVIEVIHDSDEVQEYVIPANFTLFVKEGDLIVKGTQLTEGNISPSQLLRLKGTEVAQKYIVKEVQDIYASPGAGYPRQAY